MNQFTYDIKKLPSDAGHGWRLCLLDQGREVASRAIRVFLANPAHVDAWWASLSPGERAFWTRETGTGQLERLYLASQAAQAYLDARALALAWVKSQELRQRKVQQTCSLGVRCANASIPVDDTFMQCAIR